MPLHQLDGFINMVQNLKDYIMNDISLNQNNFERLAEMQVINLSNINFTKEQTDVLRLGLSFNPAVSASLFERSRNIYRTKLLDDVENTIRKLKYKTTNEDNLTLLTIKRTNGNTLNVDFSKFKIKSKYDPPIYNQDLINCISYFKEEMIKAPFGNFQDNFSKIDRRAFFQIKQMIDNQNLIYTKADKLSQFVVLRKADYIRGCERLLLDKNNYKLIDYNNNRYAAAKIKRLCLLALRNHVISKSLFNYLIENTADPKTRQFYCLPKTHKEMSKWIDNIPPFRPIVSDTGSETSNSGKVIAEFLKPIFEKVPSYLKNSFALLSELKSITIRKDQVILVADVDSLYPSIPTNIGLDRIRQKLNYENPQDRFLFDLLQIHCETNCFMFNNQCYQQIKGIPMGKSWSPAFASIYMEQWDKELLSKLTNKPILYRRYIDDIISIHETMDDAEMLINIAKSIDQNIRLGSYNIGKRVTFMDLNIELKDVNFVSSVYHKLEIGNLLIDRKSDHPDHTKIGVINCQLIRYLKIISSEEELLNEYKLFFSKLYCLRHYDKYFLLRCLLSFLKWFGRTNNLLSLDQNSDHNVYLVTTYHNDAPKFQPIIDQFCSAIPTRYRTKFNKICIAYRSNKNLFRNLFRY